MRTIFTVSGNQVLPLFDALLDAEIYLLSTRHEAAAVHMADAWGQLTGGPGVALVTAGPGHANSLTALGVARGNESPVLLLSGASELPGRGTGAFQDLAQPELAAVVAKWAAWVDEAPAAGSLIDAAWRIAEGPIPGPVALSIPFDVQLAAAEPPAAPSAPLPSLADGQPVGDLNGPLDGIVAAVDAAREPLLLGSPSVARSTAFNTVTARLGCPAFALESARAGSDPILFGSEAAMQRADLIVLMAPWDYTSRTPALLGAGAVLQVWASDAPSSPPPSHVRRVRVQPLDALQAILARCTPRTGSAARQNAQREQGAARAAIAAQIGEPRRDGVHPFRLAEAVARRLGADDVVTMDGGEFCQWVRLALAWGPWRTLINGKFGPIGTAVPHALGARVAVGQRPTVVGFAGDGGFGYHALEIETAAREHLPALLIVGTDGKWGAEWHLQRLRYGAERTVGSELSVAHYEELARGLGGVGLLLTDEADIEGALDTAWRAMRDGQVVLLNALIPPLPSPAALH